MLGNIGLHAREPLTLQSKVVPGMPSILADSYDQFRPSLSVEFVDRMFFRSEQLCEVTQAEVQIIIKPKLRVRNKKPGSMAVLSVASLSSLPTLFLLSSCTLCPLLKNEIRSINQPSSSAEQGREILHL